MARVRLGAGRKGLGWVILAALAFVGCGDGGTDPGVDPALAPFVGDWVATKLVMTSVANPSVAPDLIALGSTFKLNVQPSGQYTAILIYAEQGATEIGNISVSGNTVTLNRVFPSRGTTHAVFAFSGNKLTLEGDTEFDFNLDGTPEPALVRFELVKG